MISNPRMAALLFATMAMNSDMWGGGAPAPAVKEKPKKECPICHTMHDGKHMCCSGDCFRALKERQRAERKNRPRHSS